MKFALVTGGSRGIGRAVCLKMADMGYNVLINYKSNETEANQTLSLVKEKGVSGEIIQFDVSDKNQVQSVLGGWMEANSEKVIEVLVNNAGIRGRRTDDVDERRAMGQRCQYKPRRFFLCNKVGCE
jgi:3-oxoacyl-[acyl-carrier protein] reductase